MSRNPLEFGFRRRCGWCGRVLRGWQLNLCRRCKQAAVYSDTPPFQHASQWDAPADDRRGATR